MHQVLFAIPPKIYAAFLRHLSICACCVYLCSALSLTGLAQDRSEEEPAPPSRENPILREYFRRQFRDLRLFDDSHRPGGRRFVENFIDRQIDHYLSELREKLTLVKKNSERAERARQEAYGESLPPALLPGKQRDWREALNEVDGATGDLRRMLIYVFTGLKDKDDFEPRLDQWREEDPTYEKAMSFLGEEIEKAELAIGEYLFTPTNKVHLEDLQGDNMLINLYHVEKLAKALKDERIGMSR